MLTKDNIVETLADAVMNRPREFFIDNKRFCLWSPSLGMSMMLDRHLSSLGVDYSVMVKEPFIEASRIVSRKREEVCYILSILSFRHFDDLSNSQKLKKRADYFSSHMSDDDIANVLCIALFDTKSSDLISNLGIEKEQKERSQITQSHNKNSKVKSFGGKSIYGNLIDVACERYGWTKQYVVWGIDLLSLELMIADAITPLTLTDEDMKSLGIIPSSVEKIGMSSEDFAKLKALTKE